jgi:hypothetical protein
MPEQSPYEGLDAQTRELLEQTDALLAQCQSDQAAIEAANPHLRGADEVDLSTHIVQDVLETSREMDRRFAAGDPGVFEAMEQATAEMAQRAQNFGGLVGGELHWRHVMSDIQAREEHNRDLEERLAAESEAEMAEWKADRLADEAEFAVWQAEQTINHG